MRGAVVPPTWRICWVQDAHYAQGRAGRAADLHQERISGGPDAMELAGLRPATASAEKGQPVVGLQTFATGIASLGALRGPSATLRWRSWPAPPSPPW